MSAPSEPSSADGLVEEKDRYTDAGPHRAGHPLVRYVLRRIGVSVLLVVGVTLVTFVLTNLVPGDTVAANLGQQAAADPTIVAAYRAHYGLDKPLPVHIAERKGAARSVCARCERPLRLQLRLT